MICVSIQNKTYEEIIGILARPEVEMAEIRLDLCTLSDEELKDVKESLPERKAEIVESYHKFIKTMEGKRFITVP